MGSYFSKTIGKPSPALTCARFLDRLRTLAALRRHLRLMLRQQAPTFGSHIGHIIATLLSEKGMPAFR